MAITFPTSPSVNQVFTSGNKSWKWTGSEWIGNFSGSIDADTVDGINSTSFLRADQSDSLGAVTTTWNGGYVKVQHASNGRFTTLNYDQLWSTGGPLHLNYSEANDIQMCHGGGSIKVGAFQNPPEAKLHVAKNDSGNTTLPTGTVALFENNDDAILTIRSPSDGANYSGIAFVDNNIGGWVLHGDGGSGDGLNLGGYGNVKVYVGSSSTVIPTNRTNVATYTSSAQQIHGNGYTDYGPNSSWSATLRVGGNGNTSSNATVATTNGNLHLDARDGSYGVYLNWYASSTTGTYFGNGSSGQVGRIDASGNATFSGQVTASSDIRLKTDIRPIDDPLSIVSKLNGYLYTKDGLENQVGVIAQEVEEVLPSMVLTSDDEMQTKSVNYGNLVAVLIEAMKEQQKRIETLEERLNGNNN